MDKKIWVVVADSSRARIFNADMPHDPLVELPELNHPASRNKAIDRLSDRPGRDSNNNHSGSHTVGHEKESKSQEALSFAREISQKIETSYHQQKIRRLYLMTSPHMLGLLRKQLSPEVSTVIAQESDINLVKEHTDIIRSHLPKKL